MSIVPLLVDRSAGSIIDGTYLSPAITTTRPSSATAFSSSGVLTTFGNDVLRPDYNPATLALRGRLIEGARTNLVLNSATLATQGVTVTAVQHTLSFYGTGSITLSGVATGTLNGTGATNLVQLQFTPTAGTLTLTVSGSVLEGQLEIGSFASSRIRTTGATATRAADSTTTTNAAIIASKTFVFNFNIPALPASGVVSTIMQLDSGADTAATRVSVDVSSAGAVILRGGTANTTSLGTYTAGTNAKVAISFDGSNIYGSLASAATVTAASTQAGSFTTLRLGRIVAEGASLAGYIVSATALPNTTTTPNTL